MVRTVISLDPEDKAWLDRQAALERVPMTRLVQRAIQRQFLEPAIQAVRLNVLEPLTVHAWRSIVRFAAGVGESQNVLAIHLVVQRMKPLLGRFLRFGMQCRLQLLNACRRC